MQNQVDRAFLPGYYMEQGLKNFCAAMANNQADQLAAGRFHHTDHVAPELPAIKSLNRAAAALDPLVAGARSPSKPASSPQNIQDTGSDSKAASSLAQSARHKAHFSSSGGSGIMHAIGGYETMINSPITEPAIRRLVVLRRAGTQFRVSRRFRTLNRPTTNRVQPGVAKGWDQQDGWRHTLLFVALTIPD